MLKLLYSSKIIFNAVILTDIIKGIHTLSTMRETGEQLGILHKKSFFRSWANVSKWLATFNDEEHKKIISE